MKYTNCSIIQIEQTQNPRDMSNILNNFFASIRPKLAENFDNDNPTLEGYNHPPVYERHVTDYATVEKHFSSNI